MILRTPLRWCAMRSGGHPDTVQSDIVKALRAVGASVTIITQVGGGAPDLLIGFRRRTFVQEVKTDDGELNELQVKWHATWRGHPVDVVRTPLESLAAIGAVRKNR